MKDQNLSRYYKVDTPSKAKVFKNPFKRQLLLRCINEAQSIKNLSDTMGADLGKVHYHILRMQNLGLLKISKTQSRSGREIKFYQSVAEGFFVPIEFGFEMDITLRESFFSSLDKSILEEDGGTLFHVSPTGKPNIRKVSSQDSKYSKKNESWVYLNLNSEDLENLNNEVIEVIKKYKNISDEKSFKKNNSKIPSTLVHFAYAPKPF